MGRLALIVVVGALTLGAGRVEAAQCTPVSIDFGDAALFLASKPQTVTITNPDNAPIQIVKLDLSGGQAQWFVLSAPPMLPLQLAANGGVTTVDVVTVPLGNGPGTGRLDVYDANGLSCSVPLKTNGVKATPILAPSGADFGPTPVMVDSKPRVITLDNLGLAPLHVTGFEILGPEAGAFRAPNPPVLPLLLNPKQPVFFEVVFHPVDLGDHLAWVELHTDDPMSKVVKFPLTGTGVATGYSIDRNTLDFTTAPGSVAPPQSFRISNDSGGAITVGPLTLVGADPQVFSIDDSGPFTIASSGSRAINVTFSALDSRQFLATVKVEVMGFAPAAIQLRGRVLLPVVAASPTAIDFSVVPKCDLSSPRTVTVRNTGLGTAHIASIRPADPDFRVDLSATKLDLAPGQETTFDAFFAPTDGGTRSSSIAITLAGETKPIQTIVVRGTGGAQGSCIGDSGCAIGGGPPAALLPILLLLLAALAIRRNQIH